VLPSRVNERAFAVMQPDPNRIPRQVSLRAQDESGVQSVDFARYRTSPRRGGSHLIRIVQSYSDLGRNDDANSANVPTTPPWNFIKTFRPMQNGNA
jgi:hypothetical protein